MISLKYGVEKKGGLPGLVGAIINWVVETIRKGATLLSTHSSFAIGDGSRVHFLQDRWCGNDPLCVLNNQLS